MKHTISDGSKLREVIATAICGNADGLSDQDCQTVYSFALEVARDCQWNEGSFDVALHELTPADVVRNMARHYDGGMTALVRDALAAESSEHEAMRLATLRQFPNAGLPAWMRHNLQA